MIKYLKNFKMKPKIYVATQYPAQDFKKFSYAILNKSSP